LADLPQLPTIREDGGQSSFSLREVVFILYRRRLIVFFVALPIVLIGSRGLFQQTGSVTAACRVMVELSSPDQPRWDTRSVGVDFDRELSTMQHMAMSVPVGELAANLMVDSVEVLIGIDPMYLPLRNRDNLVEFLLGGLDVNALGESNMLDITFTCVHPRVALMGVEFCRDAFMEYSISAGKNPMAISYYDDQIRTVTAEIDSLLVLRGNAMRDAGYLSLEDDLQYDSGQLTSLEDDFYEAKTERAFLQSRLSSIRESLKKDPNFVPTGDRTMDRVALNQLLQQVGKHRDELNQLLAIHPPESVPVKRQQETLDRSESNLRAGVRSHIESLENELQAARQRERTLQSVIDEIREEMARAPAIYQKVTLLDSEINIRSRDRSGRKGVRMNSRKRKPPIVATQTLLEDLQVKRGEVRISEMADDRISRMVRLTEPEMMEMFASGRPLMYFAIICLLAISLGVVAAFIVDNGDHRIHNRRQAEQYLRVPVFASISQVK